METTLCPLCHADIPVPESSEGACPACGGALHFLDAPEIPCRACGDAVAVMPGREAVRCSCGHLQAVEDRPLRFVATCPRCRRRIDVPQEGTEHTCPHCRTALTLQDTL